MYDIRVQPGTGLVSVTLSGMMSLEEAGRYIEDLKRAFVRNQLREWSLLLDITDCPIQQQDIIGALGRHMATMPKARAIAIVTGSSLAKMQVRRLFKQPYARITASIPDAQAWIASGIEPPVEAPRSG